MFLQRLLRYRDLPVHKVQPAAKVQPAVRVQPAARVQPVARAILAAKVILAHKVQPVVKAILAQGERPAAREKRAKPAIPSWLFRHLLSRSKTASVISPPVRRILTGGGFTGADGIQVWCLWQWLAIPGMLLFKVAPWNEAES